MHLHEEIGPRETSISAIAGRAGVQRLTVYRHFPDETAVFQACTAHWLTLNPLPDPEAWAGIMDPVDRFRAAVTSFYAYYSRTRRMWHAAYRDVNEVPALQQPMAEVKGFVAGIAEGLVRGFPARERTVHLNATIHHALHFLTWSQLEEQGLEDGDKVDLVMRWLGFDLGTANGNDRP